MDAIYLFAAITTAVVFIIVPIYWIIVKKGYEAKITTLEANQRAHIESMGEGADNYPHKEMNADIRLSEKYSAKVGSIKTEKYEKIADEIGIENEGLENFPLMQLDEMFISQPIPAGEAEMLHNEVKAILDEEYATYVEEKAFEYLSLEVVKNIIFSDVDQRLFQLDAEVVGDANDEGIDSYIIQSDPMGTNYGMTLVQSKWHMATTNNNMARDNHEPLDKLSATAMRIWKGTTPVGNSQVQSLFTKWNELIADHEQKVEEYAWSEPPKPSFYLVMVCNEYIENGDNIAVKDSLNATVLNLMDVKIWHENQGSDPVPTKKEIVRANLSPVYESADGKRRDFVGAITADEFCRLYNINKSTMAKKTRNSGFLFGNVRNRLSSTKKNTTALEILRKVSATIENEPNEFFSRNNGMTIVVHRLTEIASQNDDSSEMSRRYLFESPQLVNGGQTANALWDKYTGGETPRQQKEMLEHLQKISILVKIVEIRDTTQVARMDIMAKVASSSNHQNPVVNRDLHSVLRPMRDLKKLVQSCSIFFETKQGEWKQQKSTNPQDQQIFKLRQGVPAKLDNDLVATNLWVIFGGGAIANAKNGMKWDDDTLRKILFYEEPVETTIEQKYSLIENDQRWNLDRERSNYIPEIIYAEFLYQEIAENLMKKAKGKTTALNRLSIDSDLKLKLGVLRKTINGWSNIALAFDQAMRIRCGNENREEYLKFFIGDPVGNRESIETKDRLQHIFQSSASYVKNEFDNIKYDDGKVTISYFDSKSLHEEYEQNHQNDDPKWSFLKMLDLTINIMIESYEDLLQNNGDYTGSPGERRKRGFFQDIVQRLQDSEELKYIALNDTLKNDTIKKWEEMVSDLLTNCNDKWGPNP
tara:strand:- start:1050 stop:3662 length:2613 start_codon:yes stop_codon:yes gene_type:complete